MSGRGKAAGAALKIAAPEAAAAGAVAGKAGGGKPKKAPVPDPRKTQPGSEAARQRQAVEDVKAARKPEPEPDEHENEHEHEDQGGDAGGRFAPFAGMQGPATGGGFALGLITWALVRAYIGNPGHPSGAAGVKALLLAKFLNKTAAK